MSRWRPPECGTNRAEYISTRHRSKACRPLFRCPPSFARFRAVRESKQVRGIVRLNSRMTIAALGIAAAGLVTQRAHPQQANQYVDPARCEACHADIADKFRKTGMGRSFYRLQQIGRAHV